MKFKKTALCFSFVCIILFAQLQSFALTVDHAINIDSTTPPRKPHKLNKNQFLLQHGSDDTSRALIRYYYDNYQINKFLVAHSGGSMVISAGLAGLIVLTSGVNGLAFLLVLLLAATAYIAALFFVITSLFLLDSNRKSLYKLVQNYKEGKGGCISNCRS